MKDLHSGLTAVAAIGPAVLTATAASSGVDMQGYNGVEILLSVGVGGITFDATNKVDFLVTHSNDDATYTAVTDADVLGVTGISGGIVKSLQAAHAAADVYRFGYRGHKRYVKVSAVFSGTHGTGTPISAAVVKGYGYSQPEADQA